MINPLAWSRTISLLAAFGLFVLTVGSVVAAFPDRPVHLVVGAAPGGGMDSTARLYAQKLTEMWGQSVIIDNKPGASNSIAADLVAHAPPDGYMLGWINNNHTVSPSQFKLNYDPIKSFIPISLLMLQPDVLVINPSVPAKTLGELIAYAKANPGKLNFGSAGTGTAPYLEMALLMQRSGFKMTNVSFQGMAPATVALLGGEIQLMFGAVTTSFEQVKAGKVRALAVTSAKPVPLIGNVPTVAEAANLPGYDEGTWIGVLAPAGTPGSVASKIREDMIKVSNLPDMKEHFASLGIQAYGTTPDEFKDFLIKDIQKWSDILKSINGN